MSIEQSSESQRDETEILRENVNSLISLFELDDRQGKFVAQQELADRITRIIQMHTTEVSEGYNRIGDPNKFLVDLRNECDQALAETDDESEKQIIKGLFKHVDMPGLEVQVEVR